MAPNGITIYSIISNEHFKLKKDTEACYDIYQFKNFLKYMSFRTNCKEKEYYKMITIPHTYTHVILIVLPYSTPLDKKSVPIH